MTNPYGQQPGGYAQPPAAPPGAQPGFPGQAPPPGQPQMAPGQPSGGFPAQPPVAPGHPGGAFPAPPGQVGYPGQGFNGFGGGPQNYANWGQRVAAMLIDNLPPSALNLIGIILLLTGAWVAGLVIVLLSSLGTLVWNIVNRWIKGGNTGQSLGKRVMGIKLVGEHTGQPIGAGAAFGRDLAHFLDGIACYLGFLWPLWDDKSQTFADKIIGSIVVQAAPDGPGGGQGFPQQQGGFGQQPGGFAAPQQPYGGYPPQQPGYGQPPQRW